MATAIQLAFTLRTSTNVKTVHLVGNWDGYQGQLPLSRDPSKSGSWKGNFRFQSATLNPGKRYWYYYIMDGYHVSHDPAKPATKEPTTGRQLNILDVPASASSKSHASSSHSATAQIIRPKVEIPTGRGISPSRIISPKPSKPYASRGIREADYSRSPIDELESQFSGARIYDDSDNDSHLSSPSSRSSLSSRSGMSSPTSSLSSLSDRSASSCHCNRFGITRSGNKIRLDCGGSRCGGYSDEDSCSESEDEPQQEHLRQRRSVARGRGAPVIKPKTILIAPKSSTAAGASSSRRR